MREADAAARKRPWLLLGGALALAAGGYAAWTFRAPVLGALGAEQLDGRRTLGDRFGVARSASTAPTRTADQRPAQARRPARAHGGQDLRRRQAVRRSFRRGRRQPASPPHDWTLRSPPTRSRSTPSSCAAGSMTWSRPAPSPTRPSPSRTASAADASRSRPAPTATTNPSYLRKTPGWPPWPPSPATAASRSRERPAVARPQGGGAQGRGRARARRDAPHLHLSTRRSRRQHRPHPHEAPGEPMTRVILALALNLVLLPPALAARRRR